MTYRVIGNTAAELEAELEDALREIDSLDAEAGDAAEGNPPKDPDPE